VSEPGPFYAYSSDGEQVVLPSTVGGIRRALSPDLVPEFNKVVDSTAAQDLFTELASWAVKTRPDLVQEDEAAFRRLEQGDFSGLTAAEDIPELALLDEENEAA
jgi:50S ribosomal subunit-associated GTPase HflX